MANAIIGLGFIGKALKQYADEYLHDEEWIVITRQNYESWIGHKFNTLVWAGGTSIKQAPVEEIMKANVIGYLSAVQDFPADKMVYISSQAVYEGYDKIKWHSGEVPQEEVFLPPTNMSRYGQSKVLGEYITRESYDRWLILRPNGFVGPGLKKNVVYDLSQENPTLYVSWDSRFQYIHTQTFAGILFEFSRRYRNDIINIAPSDSITAVEVANILKVDIKKVQMPADRVIPRAECVIDARKMGWLLEDMHKPVPSCAGEIRYWMRQR
jgi:nucleoside-diphosphate-sugar epimerase